MLYATTVMSRWLAVAVAVQLLWPVVAGAQAPGPTPPIATPPPPGFWVAETTAGYHYPPRWVLQEISPGTHSWSW